MSLSKSETKRKGKMTEKEKRLIATGHGQIVKLVHQPMESHAFYFDLQEKIAQNYTRDRPMRYICSLDTANLKDISEQHLLLCGSLTSNIILEAYSCKDDIIKKSSRGIMKNANDIIQTLYQLMRGKQIPTLCVAELHVAHMACILLTIQEKIKNTKLPRKLIASAEPRTTLPMVRKPFHKPECRPNLARKENRKKPRQLENKHEWNNYSSGTDTDSGYRTKHAIWRQEPDLPENHSIHTSDDDDFASDNQVTSSEEMLHEKEASKAIANKEKLEQTKQDRTNCPQSTTKQTIRHKDSIKQFGKKKFNNQAESGERVTESESELGFCDKDSLSNQPALKLEHQTIPTSDDDNFMSDNLDNEEDDTDLHELLRDFVIRNESHLPSGVEQLHVDQITNTIEIKVWPDSKKKLQDILSCEPKCNKYRVVITHQRAIELYAKDDILQVYKLKPGTRIYCASRQAWVDKQAPLDETQLTGIAEVIGLNHFSCGISALPGNNQQSSILSCGHYRRLYDNDEIVFLYHDIKKKIENGDEEGTETLFREIKSDSSHFYFERDDHLNLIDVSLINLKELLPDLHTVLSPVSTVERYTGDLQTLKGKPVIVLGNHAQCIITETCEEVGFVKMEEMKNKLCGGIFNIRHQDSSIEVTKHGCSGKVVLWYDENSNIYRLIGIVVGGIAKECITRCVDYRNIHNFLLKKNIHISAFNQLVEDSGYSTGA